MLVINGDGFMEPAATVVICHGGLTFRQPMPSAKKKAALGAAWKILAVSLFALIPKNLRRHKRRTYISTRTPRARSGTFPRRDILPFCSLRPMPITVVATREIAPPDLNTLSWGVWDRNTFYSTPATSPGVGLRYPGQELGGLMVAALPPEATRDDYGAFFPRPSADAIC